MSDVRDLPPSLSRIHYLSAITPPASLDITLVAAALIAWRPPTTGTMDTVADIQVARAAITAVWAQIG